MAKYTLPPERQFMHRAVHLVLSLVMLWLAYIFTDNEPTFETNSAYRFMAEVMSEHQWGYVCLTCGVFGAATVLVGDWQVRIFSAVLLGAMHGWIAFEIWKAGTNVTAPGLYLGFAILGFALAYSTGHLSQRRKERVAPADL